MTFTDTLTSDRDRPGSRALNIAAERAAVVQMCQKHDVAISAIETLASGGTHVVMVNSAGAEQLRQIYGTKVILGPVTRSRWTQSRI